MTLVDVGRDPSLELQAAMLAALRADTGLRALFKGWPRVIDDDSDADFPYIRIGEDQALPLDRETPGCIVSSTEVYSVVRIYSRAPGQQEWKRIAARVRFVLSDPACLALSGFCIVSARCEGVDAIPHGDSHNTKQARCLFRYLINPTA